MAIKDNLAGREVFASYFCWFCRIRFYVKGEERWRSIHWWWTLRRRVIITMVTSPPDGSFSSPIARGPWWFNMLSGFFTLILSFCFQFMSRLSVPACTPERARTYFLFTQLCAMRTFLWARTSANFLGTRIKQMRRILLVKINLIFSSIFLGHPHIPILFKDDVVKLSLRFKD